MHNIHHMDRNMDANKRNMGFGYYGGSIPALARSAHSGAEIAKDASRHAVIRNVNQRDSLIFSYAGQKLPFLAGIGIAGIKKNGRLRPNNVNNRSHS